MTLTPHFIVTNLRVVGALMALLVVINLFVPRRFHWREEMAGLSLLNRQIFQLHSAFIVLILGLFAALLLIYGDALVDSTPLARAVLTGLTIFWTARMIAQWFFYSPDVWRGNRFNTAMHYLFSAAWIYVTATFAAALWVTARP